MTALLFGTFVLLAGLIWQISRKRREQFLQSRVIAATGSSVLVTDATVPRHPIVSVNPAFRLLTGYSDDDVIGQTTQLLHGPHTDRSAVEKIGLALQDGRPVHLAPNLRANLAVLRFEARQEPPPAT